MLPSLEKAKEYGVYFYGKQPKQVTIEVWRNKEPIIPKFKGFWFGTLKWIPQYRNESAALVFQMQPSDKRPDVVFDTAVIWCNPVTQLKNDVPSLSVFPDALDPLYSVNALAVTERQMHIDDGVFFNRVNDNDYDKDNFDFIFIGYKLLF